jgi:hypothetical protein
VAGGVHAGTARTAKEEKLDELAEGIMLDDMSAALRSLRGVIAVYCPLWQAINDVTHATEIWRCRNRIKLRELPPWM